MLIQVLATRFKDGKYEGSPVDVPTYIDPEKVSSVQHLSDYHIIVEGAEYAVSPFGWDKSGLMVALMGRCSNPSLQGF